MFRKFLALSLIFILTFTSCLNKSGTDNNTETVEQKPGEKVVDPILEQIGNMTLDEKIGQIVFIGVDGYTNDEVSKDLIEKRHAGGVILLGQNIKNTKQTLELINSIKVSNSKNRFPLFIGIDEEGGRITRLPVEIKKLPTNKEIGKINNSEFSYKIGDILGRKLNAFGINMNFAPVLDINSNPKNPIIGDRSFGTNPEIVSKLGIETMKGISSQGIIAVVKHFPGHGDTSVDSHIGVPFVNNDLERLKNFELLPFEKAISNGVDAVMVAHILLTEIDSENPATLSRTVITDILREELDFKGVVITDDMTMGAVVKNYEIGEASVKAFNAGNDIILVCHDYDKMTRVINALRTAVENKVISEDRLNESLYRIFKLKGKYKINDETVESVNVKEINDYVNGILNRYIK